MSILNPWLVFLGMAAVTFLTRFAMMPLMARDLPKRVADWLQLVPVALLSALIAPAILVTDGQWVVGARAPAALVGAVVAWRTRSVLPTLMAGMACYLLLMWA